VWRSTLVIENREAIIRPISKKVDDIFCKLYRPGRKAVTVQAMDDAVKNRIKEQFK